MNKTKARIKLWFARKLHRPWTIEPILSFAQDLHHPEQLRIYAEFSPPIFDSAVYELSSEDIICSDSERMFEKRFAKFGLREFL